MPRFTTKDLLIGMTLLAVGMGLLVYSLKTSADRKGDSDLDLIFLWFWAGSLIGAGIMTPFKRAMLGAVIAFVIQFFLILIAPTVQSAS